MPSSLSTRYGRVVYLIAGLGLYCISLGSANGAETSTQVLQSRLAQLHDRGSLEVQGAKIERRPFLPEFYKQTDYRLVWTARMDNARALSHRISASNQEGLVPADYFAAEIQTMLAKASRTRLSVAQQVDLDILLSVALARYAYHLRFGKVNPERLDADWNLDRSLNDLDPLEALRAVIASTDLHQQLDTFVPQLPFYQRLRDALVRYLAIRDAGAWPTIPAGPALKPGKRDERVARVRQRLVASGDLAKGTAGGDPSGFDAELQAAVVRFQDRHGLDADGVIGKMTLAAMNVPVAARIDQLRVNLDRARWVSQDLPDTFIIVDIAGFRARLFRDGEAVWDERVQVGKRYRKTPVFRKNMTYLEINPTWTIPPTILARDILPKIKQDPAYLQKKHFQVLSHDGKVIDPDSIDWASMTARRFPYIIRQTPGPHNALGRVKFIFPNPHFVYLHDTPHRELFAPTSRAFSSGCIRVDNPYGLAELLLQDADKWNREKIEAAIDTLKRQRITLAEPVPVLLLYWTVSVDEDGTVHFKDDVYQRDDRVLAALNDAFRYDAPAN